MLNKISLFLSLTLLLSCGKDNDDIVLPNDVSNIDLNTGIIFGRISTNCSTDCVSVFKFTNTELFLSNNSTKPVNSADWTFDNCPISESSKLIANGVQNLPRGIRDFESKKLSPNSAIKEFYVVEYVTSGNRKNIEFNTGNFSSLESERIKSYFNFIISTTQLLEQKGDTPPATCP